MEFTKMNTEETAATVFVAAQRHRSINGVRNIPPPVPVRPESKPRPAPVARAVDFPGARVSASDGGLMSKRVAENQSTSPSPSFRPAVGNAM
jgi:hypothetical protein